MSDIELKAYNYYSVIEEYKSKGIKIQNTLAPKLWKEYISISNELTGNKVIVKKCIRCLIRAHGNLSDYFKTR